MGAFVFLLVFVFGCGLMFGRAKTIADRCWWAVCAGGMFWWITP